MKLDYQFSNLCGTVYRKGNVLFSANGDCLYSPVGNRVTCFDLKNNKSATLPFHNTTNIKRLCLCPFGSILLSVDEDNRCVFYNLRTNVKIHQMGFKKRVFDVKMSPNGKYFAVTQGRGVQVWTPPGSTKEYMAVNLVKSFQAGYDETTSINWSTDSRFLLLGGKDMTGRIISMETMDNFKNWVLTGHRDVITNCFFEKNSLNCYTVSRDGALFQWCCNRELKDFQVKAKKRKHVETDNENEQTDNKDGDDLAKWALAKKCFYYEQGAKLSSAEYHKTKKILVVGFTNGLFKIHELPDFILIHTLSITQHKINTVAINPSCDWLAFGSSSLGQLLVWEWQSETYILKQQGHFYNMNVMAYSPDGQFIVTGGDDAKVKVWNTISGFCFVTFTQHTGAITGVEFNQNGQVVLSSSMDGTVRAFDLNRYRNFRTFTAPRPCHFSCLALDSSGEIICAGSLDAFEIFMWSMQTGRLLEVLAGHEGPVSTLSFSPVKTMLASGSWDNTVRLWDVYARTNATDVISVGANVTAVTYRGDGDQIAVAALDGEIKFFETRSCTQVATIEGRNELGLGKRRSDLVSAKKLLKGKCFTSLCYSADGRCILAGGKSKYVCIYNVEEEILLRRYPISFNMSLDGMSADGRSKHAEGIDPMDLDAESDEDEQQYSLPGVKKGDMSSRRVMPEVQTKSLRFSPAGRSWGAATTEGLLIFSLDGSMAFQPDDLTIDVTPLKIIQLSQEKKFSLALNYAFRLNEEEHLKRVVENIAMHDVEALAQGIHTAYLDKFLSFVGRQLEVSPHLHFYLAWCKYLLSYHGNYLKSNSRSLLPTLRLVQKNLSRHSGPMNSLCDNNLYTLKYLLSIPSKSDAHIQNDDTEDVAME